MAYPPPVTTEERTLLEVIARGHPQRTMNVRTFGGASGPSINALEWNEVQIGVGLTDSELGDSIAHLVAGNLIDSAREIPGLLARLRGAEEKYYFWITPLGRKFLSESPADVLPQVSAAPARGELKPPDIDDAVRIYENSLSATPYVKPEDAAWAGTILDDDIRAELEEAARELEVMWLAFERMFGHRGPAKIGRETEIRDPVVKRTTVRMLRAKDEQCRRFGFPPAPKPGAWLTHYQGGDVGLEAAPWENESSR
ncbi:MAG: hypothetical protein JWN71_3207 [Xanthobacteraceae bacterium]|nr:hypothetical protein [Xanthobacteraceae bacterium]